MRGRFPPSATGCGSLSLPVSWGVSCSDFLSLQLSMSTCAGRPGGDTRTTGTAHRAHLQVTRPGLLHPRGTPPASRGTRGCGGFPPSSPQEGAPDRPEAGVQPGPVGTFVTPQSPPLTGPSSLSGHPGGQISVWQETLLPASVQAQGSTWWPSHGAHLHPLIVCAKSHLRGSAGPGN